MSSVVTEIWQDEQHPCALEGWEATTPLPTPRQLKAEVPLSPELAEFQHVARQHIVDVLNSRCQKRLLIVGPCSLHDVSANMEYALQLYDLAQEVRDVFYVVMRCHFEKPRTSSGWKGMIYDPHLDGSYDVATGLTTTRHLLRDILAIGVPVAAEFLTATTPQYLGDMVSYGFVGARTVASQPHRQLASGLPMAIGVKNGTDGAFEAAIHTIGILREQQVFIGMDSDGRPVRVKTHGNPHGHLVLRGGEGGPNYSAGDVAEACRLLRRAGLPQRLVVDCSHDNCGKVYSQQERVFDGVVEQIYAGNECIRGITLESNLHAGRQELKSDVPLKYGVSLTDPCLDIATTREMVLSAYKKLRGRA